MKFNIVVGLLRRQFQDYTEIHGLFVTGCLMLRRRRLDSFNAPRKSSRQ